MSKYHLRLLTYICIIFGLIAFVGYTCYSNWQKIYKNVATKQQLEEHYNNLISEEDTLKDEVNKLQDPEYIAKYAREKYLYTKDGEIIIDVKSDNSN